MPVEIELSQAMFKAVIETAAIGFVWSLAAFAMTFAYAAIRYPHQPKPPRCLWIGWCYVTPLLGVVGMVLFHTVRITWVP